jgi:hypothetical protein
VGRPQKTSCYISVTENVPRTALPASSKNVHCRSILALKGLALHRVDHPFVPSQERLRLLQEIAIRTFEATNPNLYRFASNASANRGMILRASILISSSRSRTTPASHLPCSLARRSPPIGASRIRLPSKVPTFQVKPRVEFFACLPMEKLDHLQWEVQTPANPRGRTALAPLELPKEDQSL